MKVTNFFLLLSGVLLFQNILHAQPTFSFHFQLPPDSILTYDSSLFNKFIQQSLSNKQSYIARMQDTSRFTASPVLNTCTDKIFFQPEQVADLDTNELHFIFTSGKASFLDTLDFIQGNELIGSFYIVQKNIYSAVSILYEIGADININFGELVSSTRYLDNGDIYYINYECIRRSNSYYFRYFKRNELGYAEVKVKHADR